MNEKKSELTISFILIVNSQFILCTFDMCGCCQGYFSIRSILLQFSVSAYVIPPAIFLFAFSTPQTINFFKRLYLTIRNFFVKALFCTRKCTSDITAGRAVLYRVMRIFEKFSSVIVILRLFQVYVTCLQHP